MNRSLLAASCVVIAGCGQDVLIRTAKTCTLDTSSLGVVEEIAAGPTACARYSSGQVWCWGDNASGALGNPDGYPESHVPLRVLDVDCIAELSGTLAIVCGRRETGSVWCWGTLGSTLDRGGSVRYGYRTCSRRSRSVRWQRSKPTGRFGFGAIGIGRCRRARAHPVASARQGRRAATSRHATLLRHAGAHGRCFGWNAWGEVGDGTTDPRIEPVNVVGVNDVVPLAADTPIPAASCVDGTIAAWGLAGATGVGHDGDVLLPEKVVTTDGVLDRGVEVSLATPESTGVQCGKTRRSGAGALPVKKRRPYHNDLAIQISGLGPAIAVAAGAAEAALCSKIAQSGVGEATPMAAR